MRGQFRALICLIPRYVSLLRYWSIYRCAGAVKNGCWTGWTSKAGISGPEVSSLLVPQLGSVVNAKSSNAPQIMPQYFNSGGYVSHMVGKWHLGMYLDELMPNNRGFETYLGYLHGEDDYWTHQVR